MKFDFHKNHTLLFLTIFVGFAFISIVVAVGPAINVQNINKPLPGSTPLTPSEERGLAVYVAEGCLYCHTQQVRPLEMDSPYGRPSAPGDYARLKPLDFWRFTPSTLGTERTGPDLSDIGNRQPSEAWHYIHLYNPRAVVNNSIMQAYPWHFEIREYTTKNDVVVTLPPEFAPEKGKVVAKQEAKDLVAYLLSLKQTPIIAIEDTIDQTSELVVNGDSVNKGKQLYSLQCASCHQANGQGVPGVFPPLVEDPVINDPDPTEHINIILNGLRGKIINGVNYASAMPHHKDLLTDEEIALVVNYEREKWGNTSNPVTPEDIGSIRNK
jgi:cytochrome c oxidase cbb3-type subunit 2